MRYRPLSDLSRRLPTNIEVITSQSDVARADDNRIQALYRFNQSRADLARSNGHAEDTYGH
jgi:outer membrane protein